MKTHLPRQFLTIAALAILLGLPKIANGALIDLGHPTASLILASNVGTSDRSVAFDALSTFTVGSTGIRFDPLTGGASSITVDIRLVTPTGGVGTRGASLASSVVSITDSGLAFYDIPISFTFFAGNRYDIGFSSNAPEGWGTGINNMEFYNFNYPSSAYTVDGLVSVVDGGHGDSGYGNSVMPHIRLNTLVPEPSSAAILLLAAGGLLYRRKRIG